MAKKKTPKKELHKAKVKKAKNIDGNIQRRKAAKLASKLSTFKERMTTMPPKTELDEIADEVVDEELVEDDFFADVDEPIDH